jgi:hypothetical protein
MAEGIDLPSHGGHLAERLVEEPAATRSMVRRYTTEKQMPSQWRLGLHHK